MELTAGKLWGLRRMADPSGRFKMTAVDQRPPIKNPIKKIRKTDSAPWDDVAGFKKLLIEKLQCESSALLLDPHYAYPAGISALDPTKGLIITLEDSIFNETNEGRTSAAIDDWSVEKIKRIGGDAVKLLIWYRPDTSASIKKLQQDFAKRTGEFCHQYDIPFLLELLVYPLPKDTQHTQEYVEMTGKNSDHVLKSVEEFSQPEFGVDIFKLESPVEASKVIAVGEPGWEEVQVLFNEMGTLAGRPWVMLSAGASKSEFSNIVSQAYHAGASGYLAGRAIWSEAFSLFPDWEAMARDLETSSVEYMSKLNTLTDFNALPWHEHTVFSGNFDIQPKDETFRHQYSGFGA